MLPRLLLGAWIAAGWLAGTVAGLSAAAFRTPAGRDLVATAAIAAANEALNGTLTVREVGGGLLEGLEASGVELNDSAGSLVAAVDTVRASYRVRDLLAGRIVLGTLWLVRPRLLVQKLAPGEPTNIDGLLPRGDGIGPAPLIAFADVRIDDGTLVVRTPAGPPDTAGAERVDGPRGPLEVRRINGLDARVPYVRLSSRDPDAPIRVELAAAAARVSHPALRVLDAAGWLEYWGDSVTFDFSRVELPATRSTLAGSLSWPSGRLEFDVRGLAQRARTDDLRSIVDALPAGLDGRARFVARATADRVEFRAEDLNARGHAGGTLEGELGMILGPGEAWTFRGLRVRMRALDANYLRGFVDTLPLVGRWTGTVRLDGPSDSLSVDLDGEFEDALVPGTPRTAVAGAGVVSLKGGDFIFRGFEIRAADVSLATVERLVPAVSVDGRLGLAGTLDGPWRDVTFTGTMTHQDAPRPRSVASGRVRLDTRGDTAGVWADLTLDSLRLAGFAFSYPEIDWPAAWFGRAQVEGYLDSLAIAADVTGPAGHVVVAGLLALSDARREFRGLETRVGRLDLAGLDSGWPTTRLSATARLGGGADSSGSWRLSGDVRVAASDVRGIEIDSAVIRGVLDNGGAVVDSATVFGYDWRARARGRFTNGTARTDTLAFEFTADSVGVFEPWLSHVLGPVEPAGEEPSIPAAGRVRVGGRVTGSPEAFQVVAAVDARDVRRGSLRMTHVGGTATYVSAARSVRVDAAIDRGSVADVPVRDLELRVAGLPDSLHWQGRSRFGEFAAWIGGGRWQGAPGAWSVTLDSLGLLLASGPWFVERGSAIAVDDSGIGFGGFTLARAQGSGRLTLDGRFPLVGAASLTGAIEALPIEDALALAGRDEVPAAGELSGTVRLQGTAREPLIDVAVAVRNGSYLDFQAPYTEGTLNYRDRRLAGTLQLYRRGERIMSIELGVPLDLALAGATRRRLSGPLRVEAIAEGLDLSLLEATAPQVRDIAGTLDARFGVRGSWEDPVLAGQITVRDGAATIPALGVRHSQVNGTLALAGDTIKVESFAVRSGSGVALIGGYVRLEELSRAVLDLRVNSRDFEAMNVRDFLAVTATADLTLKGPLEHPVLTGRATATRGVLYFADLITKQIVNLEDTLFAEFVDTALVRHQRLGAEFENRFLDSLRIDSLRVQLGSDFWLRSSEANVQLSGTVHVNKVRDRYVFDGTLEAPRGTYRLQLGLGTTREFRVTRGQVRYLGTSDLNADLDLDAEHVVRTLRGENVKIGVHIGGSLYDPRLTLSSDVRPALSESEIISYLMFGAPSFQAGTQSGELGNRIVTQQVFGALSSQFEYALISDLGIPLDYLQIQPATTGGELSAVEALVGKHFEVLGTSAFLTISPRVCSRQELSAAMGASLEFRLTRNWLVAAGVDPRRACGVLTPTITTNYEFGLDLYWEKRY